MDFIERCLEVNPDKRMTADEAMNHNWLKNTKQIFDLLHGCSSNNSSAGRQ